MLRAHSALFVRLHRLLDLTLTAASFIAAYFVKKYIPIHLGGLTTTPNYYEILFLIIIIWHLTFLTCGLYESYRKRTLSRIIVEMIKAVFIGMSVLLIALYLLKITEVSRLLLVLFCLFNIVLLGISKSIVYRVLTTYRRRGFNYRNILVVGSKQRAKDIIDLIRVNSYSGLRVIGCLDVDENAIGREVAKGVKVIGLLKDLRELLLKQVVDEIIFAMPLSKIQEPQQYMLIAEQVGVSLRIVPDWEIYKQQFRPRIAAPVFENFFGNPTLAMAPTTISQDKLLIKYAFDYLFAALAFVVSLPLFIMIPLAIKAFSKGPVFYHQERCGLNGRRFMIYKFRSMLVDAEARLRELKALNEADGPVFKIKNDPRIIPYIGKLLRKTSLDELPQLINVLRGEMSLVGPRPPIPAEVEEYDDWQRRRLSMKPGLTCLWQCAPCRNEISFQDWMRMDLEYIDNWSLKLDFGILVKTAAVVLLGSGR